MFIPLCRRQFEIALVCLHTALSDCPSHSNVKYVQSKLGSDWAIEIRDRCVGQSGLATNRVPGDELSEVDDVLESSSDMLQEYLTDLEEDETDDDDALDNNRQQIIVVVPSETEDFYPDVVLSVRKKTKFRARHNYRKSRPIDVNMYNIFEEISEKRTNSAAKIPVSHLAVLIGCVVVLI